jgi:opacity protein-like surface antigen
MSPVQWRGIGCIAFGPPRLSNLDLITVVYKSATKSSLKFTLMLLKLSWGRQGTMKHTMAKLITTVAIFSLLVATSVRAENPLGVYVGAGGGRAHLGFDCYLDGVHSSTCLDATHFGWTAFAGLQPLPFLGAELQYLDFGHPSKFDFSNLTSERARALALFGTGTVSLPFVDLYAKAGLGRLRTETAILRIDAQGCVDIGHNCGYDGPRSDQTATRFGWGLGFQVKLSSLALRGEYVRFSVPRSSFPNGEPDLLSVALLWKF